MDRVGIMLAAGEASRFNADFPKQHCLVDHGGREVPVIRRAAEMWGKNLVVVVRPGVRYDVDAPVWESDLAEHTTAGDMLNCRELWSKDGVTVILFSDVYYTDAAMDAIRWVEPRPIVFHTDGQDIFALAFRSSLAKVVEGFLARVIAEGSNHGRLWELYRCFCAIDVWPLVSGYPFLHFIADETQDFDTIEEYRDFLAGRSKNVAK